MYKILKKEPLNPTVTKMVIEAPLVAKKAEPGQFIIFRASADGERVPLTIADYDRTAGTVTIIFQIVGGATQELNALNEGDSLIDSPYSSVLFYDAGEVFYCSEVFHGSTDVFYMQARKIVEVA